MSSCAELRAALGDPSVRRVRMAPRADAGGWNCTADELPPGAVTVTGRDLVVEGAGTELVYWDVR